MLAVVGINFSTFVTQANSFNRHLSVYLHDISKTDAARIIGLDIETFHR